MRGDSIDIADHQLREAYSWTSNPAGFTSSLANPSVSPSTTTYYITQEIVLRVVPLSQLP